ncbi:hypothetical protein NIES2135_26840 [Leptolyngbya boryana NIES-2135]|jgi:hypothetical protein|uniref:Uncharacterized protein n=1 Tax=Leptolyngbya boryana NIES-2135 TaxID=1973484 RepID=A0A1Z4JGI2_LEPBY|nr:hypothetical protein NIES2135_26840 [Leptolyngbya boryana NIES-2135]
MNDRIPPPNAANAGLLAYLRVGEESSRAIQTVAAVADPYMRCGCPNSANGIERVS